MLTGNQIVVKNLDFGYLTVVFGGQVGLVFRVAPRILMPIIGHGRSWMNAEMDVKRKRRVDMLRVHVFDLRNVVVLTMCLGLGADLMAAPRQQVQTQRFDIEYLINADALPVTQVELWYRVGESRDWRLYGMDGDRQSPMAFVATEEGPYEFFFVVTNEVGVSSQLPKLESQAHHVVFVDFTPPIVQLHEARQIEHLGRSLLQLQWNVIDAHLTDRPIELSYRSGEGTNWTLMVDGALSNTGRYDWPIREGLAGRIFVRLAATDRAGNRVVSEPREVWIRPVEVVATSASALKSRPTMGASTITAAEGTLESGLDTDKTRAARYYAEALSLRDQQDYRGSVSKLRHAIKLNPSMTEALTEMADIMYLLGDFDRSQGAYELALRQSPAQRDALMGSARVHRQRREYGQAAQRLRTILRYQPDDAETWMNLGDVAIFQGDEMLARECYARATQIDPNAHAVIEEARKRLSLMKVGTQTVR